MLIEIILILLTIYIILNYFKTENKNLPPGPRGYPFIGTFPFGTIEECVEPRKKYGNIFMTKMGSTKFVYICDYKLAKEAYTKMEFADRPSWKFMRMFDGEKRNRKALGIIFSNGGIWHHNRRFLLRHLRDLGMGKSKIEGIILKEVENLVDDFKLLTKRPSELPFSINIAILNVIWQLISSNRYEFNDKEVKKFMAYVTDIQEILVQVAIPDFFPILKSIIPEKLLDYIIGQNIFDEMCTYFTGFVKPVIDEHVEKLDINNPYDLMDDYLIEMKEKKSEEYSHFSYSDLTKITFDLFTAGNETTGNMTRWVLLFMAKYPNIQKKIQDDIDKFVPTNTLPGLEHRDRLAYLDATINEVQRLSSMISFGVFRSTTTDVTLGGYEIPKGTVIRSVAVFSHQDPVYWKNPDEFNPSRFLDTNGKYITNCDGFQPFGIGKRQCLGEQFARMELYMIIAGLLQTFTFGPPEGEEIDITPHEFNNFRFPKRNQNFLIKLRHQK